MKDGHIYWTDIDIPVNAPSVLPNSCMRCAKCLLEEEIVRADEFRINDPDKKVKHLVGYLAVCASNIRRSYHDGTQQYICSQYDRREVGTCSTCAHATPRTVDIINGPKIGNAAEWRSGDIDPRCRLSRVVYKCNKREKMKGYPRGTYMSAYIRCEYYRKRDDIDAED